ncbi:calcium/sodium antiporter [Alkalinema sp. FACHB-956]|uniref:calcium/sodium antiporter n=1 Tax=Alkalinema sp. FACHB-956 TaxID=2692768 RepID=UPI0016844A3B|nr:calcium/sodium antiporter [Alkalinema sp. FACHB-956]MBD2327594.1 calcium/sodium antiporter [Alkalinema sp. FACHB-956]
MGDYIVLIIGVLSAGIGGELFVRGVIGMAHWMRVSPGIIGATVAAFATSSPELSVAINAAIERQPQISLGDVLGSNIVNVGLVLGLSLVISGIQSPRDSVRRDFPIALITPIVIGVLALDGILSRLDGFILLGMFGTWMITVLVEVRKQQSAAEEMLGEPRFKFAIAFSVVGLCFLITAGHLIVIAAKGIALSFGIDEFVIGATLVAMGTSVPELATAIISKVRGHEEIGLGTILGSNIFNSLWVVGIAAILFPITVNWQEVAIALVFGLLSIAFTFPSSNGLIERRRGVLLLLLYAVYVVAILQKISTPIN